ncbi:hypothetical protein [Nostoc sp.]
MAVTRGISRFSYFISWSCDRKILHLLVEEAIARHYNFTIGYSKT